MTDSEKLDLIVAEVQGMKAEMQETKGNIQEVRQKVNRLEVGQSEIRGELYKIDRKILDTYNLALDALGMSAENRKWLENGAMMA